MATTIEIKSNIKLERMLSTDKEMEKKIRSIIRKAMVNAQHRLQMSFQGISTKEAYKAIRKAVYSKVLGGNLNIITSNKRAGNRAPLPQVVHRLENETNKHGTHRGGNRTQRTSRTEDLITYMGTDRGFVLRFLNGGTAQRTSRYGNRGSIAARNWFGSASESELNNAVTQIDSMLDELIAKEFNQ